MSKVAVVPSPRVPVSQWMPAIIKGLETAKVHGLEEVKVLGDGVPGTSSWIHNPARQNVGLIFTQIDTNWTSQQAIRERNEQLLAEVETVLVLGHIMTSSSKHALGRVFGEGGRLVIQIVDGEAKAVDLHTIQTAPGFEVTEAKTAGPREAESWSKFMAPAPKTKTKK